MKKYIILLCTMLTIASSLLTATAADSGTWQGTQNTLDFSYADKGDIYFGWNTGCTYGTWSHVALAREDATMQNWSYEYDSSNSASGYGWTNYTREATPYPGGNDVISRDCQDFYSMTKLQ